MSLALKVESKAQIIYAVISQAPQPPAAFPCTRFSSGMRTAYTRRRSRRVLHRLCLPLFSKVPVNANSYCLYKMKILSQLFIE